MPNWTRQQLERLRRITNDNNRTAQSPQPEHAVRHEPMATPAREEGNAGRFRICVTSFRRQLIDPDNLCAKYFIDCLRYAEIIPNDTEKDVEIQVRQKKAQENYTEITVEKI